MGYLALNHLPLLIVQIRDLLTDVTPEQTLQCRRRLKNNFIHGNWSYFKTQTNALLKLQLYCEIKGSLWNLP